MLNWQGQVLENGNKSYLKDVNFVKYSPINFGNFGEIRRVSFYSSQKAIMEELLKLALMGPLELSWLNSIQQIPLDLQ